MGLDDVSSNRMIRRLFSLLLFLPFRFFSLVCYIVFAHHNCTETQLNIAWHSFSSFQVPVVANAVNSANSAADGKTIDVVVVGACIVDNIR